MSAADIAERVERGAALLDGQHPGWYRRIDLARLDLKDGCNCVVGQLGQVSRDDGERYLEEVAALGISDVKGEVAHGFEAEWPARIRDDYEPLTQAWRELITARLAADPAGAR